MLTSGLSDGDNVSEEGQLVDESSLHLMERAYVHDSMICLSQLAAKPAVHSWQSRS